jgi:DNA-binding transcriptional LysR family regulator
VNVRTVNLNLLAALDALLRERNVTRAAKAVGVTQSAMSNTLRQLRSLFGDPLLVRGPRTMVPTARALEIQPFLRQGLASLDAALGARTGFDPASSERAFVLAASDYVEYVVLPRLLGWIRERAPCVRVEVRPWGLHRVPEALREGGVDLMIGFCDEVPPGFHDRLLFEESYACIVRRGHPRVRGRLTLDTYVALSHIVVSQESGPVVASVDRALAKLGRTRHVGARVSHFLMVPALVAATDLVAALSRRVAEPAARHLPVRVLPPPLPLPRGRIRQVWHARSDDDPGHLWLRNALVEVCREV